MSVLKVLRAHSCGQFFFVKLQDVTLDSVSSVILTRVLNIKPSRNRTFLAKMCSMCWLELNSHGLCAPMPRPLTKAAAVSTQFLHCCTEDAYTQFCFIRNSIEETSTENKILNKRLQLNIFNAMLHWGCIHAIPDHKKWPREGKWMINMIPTDPKRPQFLTLIDNRSDLILDSKGPSRKVVIT